MDQKRLQGRVDKARYAVKAGAVNPINGKDRAYRVISVSKPGTYHDTFLKWVKVADELMLTGSCAWVEPVTGSQPHCPGNKWTACWHVIAAIIKCCDDKGKKVAFFADYHLALRYSRLGGRVFAIGGKDVWFVTSKNRS